jgi:phage terminase small subunit
MSDIKLTEKQKLFCKEYIIDFNATRAAKAAGYSEDSAKEIGYENLRKS